MMRWKRVVLITAVAVGIAAVIMVATRPKKEHEKKVEEFYSAGSVRYDVDSENQIKHPEDGFISFGYWKPGDNYKQAAKRLVKYYIDNSGIDHAERILNVACGYGAESFAFNDAFEPEELIGLDITKVHVDYANNRAKRQNIDHKLKFKQGDAVKLDLFPDNHFSHVLGIEGPSHFNTREQFFTSANRVLKPGGILLLTDIMLGDNYNKYNLVHQAMVRAGAKSWRVPMVNAVKEDGYRKQLENAGFDVVFLKRIGDKVFPGYAQSFEWKQAREKDKKMGRLTAYGFKKIGKFLGYANDKKWIDYIYVKARKR